MVGQIAAEEFLAISPAISGSLSWENVRTISFSPTSTWKPGETYTATVNLKQAYDTLTGPNTFSFKFTVREPSISVEVAGLHTPDATKMDRQEIRGAIKSNDVIGVADLEGLLSAKQAGRQLTVEYFPVNDNGLTFDFAVSGVLRGESASSVSLLWDANKQKLGSSKGDRKIDVPALGDFKVISIDYINTGEPHLAIRFSDPLKAGQDLNGLITIDGGQQLRHRLDGNVLYAYVDAGASGSSTVKIAQSIQNAAGNSLGRDVNWQVSFTRPDPELRTVGQGTIMPHAGSRLFPFEAIGLEAVHVEIFKIFENNVLQFLQDNQLGSTSDTWSLHRVGRIISQERVLLSELAGGTDLDSWTRYAIDLSKYLEQDERAIYQVRIGFGMDDVRRQCSQRPEDFGVSIAYEKE
ncbi:MAG: Ig-like domain-containing protein, partial [Bacteroidota bacterium]